MIVVTGLQSVVAAADAALPSPVEYLRQKKTQKYMGVQDQLAVWCAGRALQQATLEPASLGERAGLFLAVGYIPFTRDDIDPVLGGSLESQEFSEARFGREGYQRAHPLLTFRCLPNIPAYHISANFNVQGRYFVSYPGPAQLYQALVEAVAALDAKEVDVALVGGVAHQRNFLVEHHFSRLCPPVPPNRLADAGGLLVLEGAERASRRGAQVLAELLDVTLSYEPFDALEAWPSASESPEATTPGVELGPAALCVQLERAWRSGAGPRFEHQLQSRDGFSAASSWRLAQ